MAVDRSNGNEKRLVAKVDIPLDISWEPGEYFGDINDPDEARAIVAGVLRYMFNIPWDVLQTVSSERQLTWSFTLEEVD